MNDKIQKKARNKSLATVKNYQIVFGSDLGKKVLWDLMKECGVMSVHHSIGDPYTTAWKDGKRSIALYILQKLKTDYQKLELRIQEGISYDNETWDD